MIPLQSIWMLRLSLIWLMISVTIGGLILIEKVISFMPMIWGFLPIHYELAIWGWLVQFAVGTAYWMFPKLLTGKRRGPDWAGWCVVFLMNTGILSLAVSHLIQSGILSAAGRGIILISICTFAYLISQRVVTYRNSGH